MKWIYHCYTANWNNIKLYPRLWINKSYTSPNFKHHSIAIRILWWYFSIQKVFKNE